MEFRGSYGANSKSNQSMLHCRIVVAEVLFGESACSSDRGVAPFAIGIWPPPSAERILKAVRRNRSISFDSAVPPGTIRYVAIPARRTSSHSPEAARASIRSVFASGSAGTLFKTSSQC